MPTTTVQPTTVVQPITRRMADADSSQTRAAQSKPAQDGDTGGRKKRVRMTKERRRELRQQRRQLWRSAHASKRTGWCARHNKCLFITINLVFVLMGCILIAMGVYGMASVWAEMFGRGPGFGVVSVGVCVILTAILGLLGMKYDNKCMLLLYFIIMISSFIALITMGAVATFNRDIVDQRFSSWWDQYETEAIQGQEEFDCCGYNDPSDRPANGQCPGNTTALPGCKDKLIAYMNSRFVPLFLCAFTFGLAQFIGIIISARLICRSTLKRYNKWVGTQANEDALKLNTYTPDTGLLELGAGTHNHSDGPASTAGAGAGAGAGAVVGGGGGGGGVETRVGQPSRMSPPNTANSGVEA